MQLQRIVVTLDKCGLALSSLTVCKAICTSIYLGVVRLLAAGSVRLLSPCSGEVSMTKISSAWSIIQTTEPSSGDFSGSVR